VGGSLFESVTLIKSESQGGEQPSPPVENIFIIQKGMKYTMLERYSLKREPQCTSSQVKLYHKDGMKHKFSIFGGGGSSSTKSKP